jgi:hypothetical protein
MARRYCQRTPHPQQFNRIVFNYLINFKGLIQSWIWDFESRRQTVIVLFMRQMRILSLLKVTSLFHKSHFVCIRRLPYLHTVMH